MKELDKVETATMTVEEIREKLKPIYRKLIEKGLGLTYTEEEEKSFYSSEEHFCPMDKGKFSIFQQAIDILVNDPNIAPALQKILHRDHPAAPMVILASGLDTLGANKRLIRNVSKECGLEPKDVEMFHFLSTTLFSTERTSFYSLIIARQLEAINKGTRAQDTREQAVSSIIESSIKAVIEHDQKKGKEQGNKERRDKHLARYHSREKVESSKEKREKEAYQQLHRTLNAFLKEDPAYQEAFVQEAIGSDKQALKKYVKAMVPFVQEVYMNASPTFHVSCGAETGEQIKIDKSAYDNKPKDHRQIKIAAAQFLKATPFPIDVKYDIAKFLPPEIRPSKHLMQLVSRVSVPEQRKKGEFQTAFNQFHKDATNYRQEMEKQAQQLKQEGKGV